MISTSHVLFGLILLLHSINSSAAIKKDQSLNELIPKKIKVAVIDTGVDIHHEKLKDSIWINSQESGFDSFKFDKSNNLIDDDHNGFIDDVHGWNFVDNNNSVLDDIGHGTHIAGIIQKNPNVIIIPIKAVDPKLSGEKALLASVKAIEYAIQAGAQIINYSAGGYERHELEEAAIKKAKDKGILIVAAAGNNKINSDQMGFFPAHYAVSNIVSVAAIDQNGRILPSSNFGPKTTFLAAPGKDIYSTLPKNKYGKLTGTSQATALVTQLLADKMLKSKNPIKALIQNGKINSSLIGYVKNPIIVSEIDVPNN